MASSCTTTTQGAWDCVWTCPTVEHTPMASGDPRVWVCVRDPHACRLVTDEDCAACPHWERRDEPQRYLW
jgi:hypothetical protein